MKIILKYKLFVALVIIGLLGVNHVNAQFLLQAPTDSDQNNFKWYEASNTNTVLGTESSYLVTKPGIYFATYDGTLCGSNATEYFIVTYCGNPDSEVTLDISKSVSARATISWEMDGQAFVPDNLLAPVVSSTEGLATYKAFVTKAGNKIKLASFTMVCILKESTLVDDVATTAYGQSVNIDILANDINIPTTSGSITINDEPAFGTVAINDNGTPNDPSDDTVRYTPMAGFTGEDSFTYIVTGAANEATVYVTVREPIEIMNVVDDVAEVDSATPSSVTIDVLANDIFTEGAFVMVSNVLGAQNGTVVINSDETITYTPNQGYEGIEEITYSVSILNPDGTTATAEGQVIITVFNSSATDEITVYQLLTPNGDGRNDVLQIENIELYPDNKVSVFNRWGAKVFETSGYGQRSNYFDGTSNASLTMSADRKLPTGVYYYVIECKVEGKTKNKAGYFYISSK